MHKIEFNKKFNLINLPVDSTTEGYINKDELHRLGSAVDGILDNPLIKITTQLDNDKIHIQLVVDALVSVTCQRCFEKFTKQLTLTENYIAYIHDKCNNKPVDSDYDILDLDRHGNIDLIDLVEDELLLSLPITPMHDLENCLIKSNLQTFGDDLPKSNPFAVLKQK